jgi:hypothetical protein
MRAPAPPLVPAETQVPVRLENIADDSVAATIRALVERGALLRPELAASMESSVQLHFLEGYPPVRIDFCGEEIIVSDTTPDDRAYDLAIEGRLPDVVTLIAAPLAGGLPKPTSGAGRAALARLADGRVEFNGPLQIGRELLRLLCVAD